MGDIALGNVIVAKFLLCKKIYYSAERIKEILMESAYKVGARIINSCHHDFMPQDASAILLLEESHYGVHTWPELDETLVGIFYTCGSLDPRNDMLHVASKLQAEEVRGIVFHLEEERLERFKLTRKGDAHE